MRSKKSSFGWCLLPLLVVLPLLAGVTWACWRYGELILDLLNAVVKLGVLA